MQLYTSNYFHTISAVENLSIYTLAYTSTNLCLIWDLDYTEAGNPATEGGSIEVVHIV